MAKNPRQVRAKNTRGEEYSRTIRLTNAQVKALRATPISLIPAPPANQVIVVEEVYAVSSTVTAGWTETADNIVLEYTDGTDIVELETTGFIDQVGIQIRSQRQASTVFTPVKNVGVQLKNNGDGEFGGGNAANTLSVGVIYRIESAVAFG